MRRLLSVGVLSVALVASAELADVHVSASRTVPAYLYRGFMLDEARHFFGKAKVKEYLDLMAEHRMNVFHWHLTDDQGWRIDLPGLPELVKVGARRDASPKRGQDTELDGVPYGPFFNTADDVREIVAYARARGITVVPEVDLPGHVRTILAARPDLACLPREELKTPRCEWGIDKDVLCLGNEETYRYVERILDAVCELFPSERIHIGGDECPDDRWRDCAKCRERIGREGLADCSHLQAAFTRHVAEYLAKKGRVAIGWDEILAAGTLPKGTVVQSWHGGETVVKALAAGHPVVCSRLEDAYLSLPTGEEGDRNWPYRKWVLDSKMSLTVRQIRALDFRKGVPPELHGGILGGECCAWTEEMASAEELDFKVKARLAAFGDALYYGPESPEGQDVPLNGNWGFRFEEGKSIEETPRTAFTAETTMSVPGCFDADARWRYKRGTGLYRRTFRIDKAVKNAWLVVEGMGLRGEFILDGRSLGVHPYPYARLKLETGPLAAGEHVLVAAIDNRLDWAVLKLARFYYDFYLFGGFYRGVSLSFDNRKLFVRTRDYRTGTVEIEAVNFEAADFPATLVFDGTNAVDAVFRGGRATMRVPNFRLWAPAHPNLHTVAIGRCMARFGVRTIEAKGGRLYLNGEPLFLKGVNRHEQSRERGVTMTDDEMARDVRILKDLGANFVRGAHYQQNQRFLDLCDEAGMLVWEESLGWGNGQNYTRTDDVDELTDGGFVNAQIHQTREMVRTSINHPSVIIFAFLNECASMKPECKVLVDRLIATIREQDTGRLVTFACNAWQKDICHSNTDIVAVNAYPGTIPANPGTKEELRQTVRDTFNEIVGTFRKRYPEKPIMISESGCSGFFGMRDETAPFGCEDFQEEYLADILETLWANKDVSGFSVWQFADTTTHQRNCASRSGRLFGYSMAGVFDFGRRPKKSVETLRRYFKSERQSGGDRLH